MPQYLAALTIVLLLGTVLGRVLLLRRTGTRAVHFGELDKTDFLIPPAALREEEFMRQRYGQEYLEYCSHVRRYV